MDTESSMFTFSNHPITYMALLSINSYSFQLKNWLYIPQNPKCQLLKSIIKTILYIGIA